MNITIQKAKNGEDTAVIEGHFLHSNYSPKKEAERFVQNLNLPYFPSAIIITEPGLSYVAEYFKIKFPSIKIGAIRYCPDFKDYDNAFDFIINYFEHKDFETFLENNFTEEDLLKFIFIPWQPSQQMFSETDKIVWNAIKASLVRSKTLLITRQYFEKKWFINSLNFVRYLSNQAEIDFPVNKDTLIISSGPSLNTFIPLIREQRKKFYIICLSSAISVCFKNQIIPDLCMTTDGGYWAGQHLKSLKNSEVPVAMPAEAFCSKNLLSKINVLPLDYGEGLSSEILKSSGLQKIKAVRNGTVSGTALLFAAANCSKNIYLCGIDMASQKGFQHAQPNQLELNSSLLDNRISSKQLRLTKSELTTGSMNIYKDWFCNNPLNLGERKVYRLIEIKDRKNNLQWIKDISLSEFGNLISNNSCESRSSSKTQKVSINKKALKKLFTDNDKIENWKKQLFPLDYVLLSHNPDNIQTKEKIESEWNKLMKKAEDIFNDNL